MNCSNNEEIIEFKKLVKEWLTIDLQLTQLQEKSKQLRKTKKELGDKMTIFMVQNKITDLNTESGLVKCSEKRIKAPLNKDNIKINLSSMIDNEIQVNQILNNIMTNREVKTVYEIKKLKPKNN